MRVPNRFSGIQDLADLMAGIRDFHDIVVCISDQ